MKRTLLFIACVLTSITMYAQEESNDYLPFVEMGKLWHVVINPTNPYVPCTFQRFKMNEEVEQDGKTYVYLEPFDDVVLDTLYQEAGLFREENRRVYKYEGGRDVMLYDFSLKEGDTFIYEYGLEEPMNCKVLKQGWLEDGPNIQMLDSLTTEGAWTFKYRKLHTWTIGVDNGSGGYNEAVTWIEGIGTLRNMFYRPWHMGVMSCLAYVERDMNKVDFTKNAYLPFPLYNMYGPVYGCDLPTGEEYFGDDGHHQLTYELEGDRLHIYGEAFTNCGPNHYAYFYESKTDDPLVNKIEFEIQDVEPLMWCEGLHATDFYVPGFDPNMNYIVVDNYGEEHPVINKTQNISYRPFIEEGKVWMVGNTIGISDGIVKWVKYYYFDGDTIIDGKTCKQMMCQQYVSPDHPDYASIVQFSSYPLEYVGAWYEEDKKVYMYNEINQLKMMYDFSLNANDTLLIGNYPYVIGPKQTGLNGFKGIYRDIMWRGDENSRYCTTWLEGVGGIEGPTDNIYYGKEGHALFLMACGVGDEVIYYNDEYEDGATPADIAGARKNRFDFTHTIKEKPKTRTWNEEDQSLYGEYNERQLSIDLNPIDEAYMVSITDQSEKAIIPLPLRIAMSPSLANSKHN